MMKVEIWINGVWSSTIENVGRIEETRVDENGQFDQRGNCMQLNFTVSE